MAAVKAASGTGRRRCGFFLVLLSAGAQALAQDYQTPFVNGMRARDQKNWSDAISHFQAAAAVRSGEGADRVSLYGMRTALYLPHYYLGEAYANSGNCVAALEQFTESERQGVVQKTGEYKGLVYLRKRCQDMVPRGDSPSRSACAGADGRGRGRRASKPGARAESHGERAGPADSPRCAVGSGAGGSRGGGGSEASRQLRQQRSLAKGSLPRGEREEGERGSGGGARRAGGGERARSDISRLRAARDAAARANQQFGDLQRLVLDSQRIASQATAVPKIASQVTAAPSPLLRDINTRVKSAGQLLADASRNRSLPAEAAGPKADLERLLGKAQKLDSASPAEQKAFADQLKSATLRFNNALRPTPAPVVAAAVPPPLLEGASAYFAGDYARAALTLESAPDSSDRHAVAEARLIRSAARYAQYVIGGAKDSGLQQRAAQDATDCRRLDPRVSPSRKVFSPRFVQFFAEAIEKASKSAS